MPGAHKNNVKCKGAGESLPDELREVFDELLEQYTSYTATFYGVGTWRTGSWRSW